MYDVGLNIGLPTRFVELRHEINHGTLPTLAVLRSYTQQALNWLYQDYWKSMGAIDYSKDVSDDLEKFSASLYDTLRQHETQYSTILLTEGPVSAVTSNSKSADTICRDITKFFCNDATKLQSVVDILVRNDMLVHLVREQVISWTC